MSLLFFASLAVTSFCLVALLLAGGMIRPSEGGRRLLQAMRRNEGENVPAGNNKDQVVRKLMLIAARIRVGLGMSGDEKLKQRLLSGGLRDAGNMDVYLACRILSPVLGLTLGSFVPIHRTACLFLFAIFGYVAPDLWLKLRVKRRRERIRRSIPDAMDLLVICVDAGLGLDQALMRVGHELAISHPDIHQEFTLINLEQRAGKPRLEAWESMAKRTTIAEFTAFVSMLTQTDRFGTPIVRALSRFADEIRLKRRQRAEEQAAKTKIKILFPLILFIFPSLFIVLLAPAVIGITRGLGAMGK